MRKLIAGMKISVDEKVEGSEGYADWVEAWGNTVLEADPTAAMQERSGAQSDDHGLMPPIDACLLGAGMYPDYERYWTAVQNGPDKPLPMTGKAPTPDEVAYARFATQTPHFVLSSTLTSALWPRTSFVRSLDDVAALKQQPGQDIYLVGGARTTASLIDAGLVDELRLIVYPLLAGAGKALFATTERRRGLELRKVQQLPGGRVSLIYGIG